MGASSSNFVFKRPNFVFRQTDRRTDGRTDAIMEAILTPAFSICRYSKYIQRETEVNTFELLSNKLAQAVPIGVVIALSSAINKCPFVTINHG